MYVDPVLNEDPVYARNTAIVLRTVDTRANLLDATNVLEQAALDKYTFVRDAFLQRRRSLIYDGNPPPEAKASLDTEDEPKLAVAPASQPEAAPAAPAAAAAAPDSSAPAVSAAPVPGPAVYTVFADGVALQVPNAAPESAPLAPMIRFADNVVLQAK
jgi:hypothetical protein